MNPNMKEKLAKRYLVELAEWQVDYTRNPVETFKSFAIFVSGCEVLQHRLDDQLLFVVFDSENVWAKRDARQQVLTDDLIQKLYKEKI